MNDEKRKHDLEKHLEKDYELLKKLEDALRLENNPKERANLESQIENLEAEIANRKAEMKSVEKTLPPQLQETVDLYLASSFERDRFVGLDQAGETDPERSTLLEKVFIDLEVTIRKGQQPPDLTPEALDQLRVPATDRPHLFDQEKRFSAMQCLLAEHWPKVAVIGGPGQGKSTLGQHLAQIHRAKLLGEPFEFEPQTARIPFRIVLKYFAQWLADEPPLDNLESYLASIVEKKSGRAVSTENIQIIFQCCPCILILDGLDEVISPELRGRMLARIREFLRRLERLDANLTVMATSRPTGYEGQFSPEQFWHLELLPLSPDKVSAFSKKWVQTKKLREEKQSRILSTIEECQQDENLSALLSTPLQVTIILLIIKDGGRPPTQREALFDKYWRTIFRRERSKAKGIIQSDESLLFNMHAYLAYLLHRRATEQNVQSLLPEKEFRQAVREFLRRRDSHSPDESINRKTDQLVREARDRLVLIVEPESGLFGFELRSLQEFFAAVHLFRTSTDTTQRFARLKAIARSEHWRNVALFFAGRVARLQGGEAGNILELVCRPLDREGVDIYLRRGAWLALEIASDEALGDYRDLQYNAIEYGLEVMETSLTARQKDELKAIVGKLPLRDRRDILRPVLKESLRSLPTAFVEPALDLYGEHFGATPLFRDKIATLLQSRREDAVLSALDLAIRCEPEAKWMVERLDANWPHWKARLLEWWPHSPNYVEKLLNSWAPSRSEVTRFAELFAERGLGSRAGYIRSRRDLPWAISELESFTDQLIAMLRCIGVTMRWERPGPLRGMNIRFGERYGVFLLPLEESQSLSYVPDGLVQSSENLLQRSDLMPWLRVQLWTLFWATNEPNLVNVSQFLDDIRKILQDQPLPDNFWRHWRPRERWPLLALSIERQRVEGSEAVNKLLPFLEANNQLSVAEQIKESLRNRIKNSDETSQRRLFNALRTRTGLDAFLPQLVPLANRMGLTLEKLIDAHIGGIRYYGASRSVEYTIGEIRDLLEDAEESLDKPDELALVLWVLGEGSWPSTPEILDDIHHLLEIVLSNSSGSKKSVLNFLIILFLRLLAYGKVEIDLRLFRNLSQSGSEEFNLWHYQGALGDLSSEHLSVLESFLTHEEAVIRSGAAVLWQTIINATKYPPIRLDEDELLGIKEFRLSPDLGISFINNDDDSLCLAGITLLIISDYPIEDVKYRQIMMNGLQHPQSVEEERAWAQFLKEVPITDANRRKWCNLFEEILANTQSYPSIVSRAAMERRQSLVSGADATFPRAKELKLGLP
jgi:hypothetical protein